MATSGKGRTGYGSSTGSTRFSFFGNQLGQSSSGRTGMPKRTGRKSGGSVTTPSGYKNCCNMFQNKIQSYKTLVNQTMGPVSRFGRPSPSTLNTFANWINKGAIIQTVSAAQVARWARTTRKNFNTRSATPTACKNVLCAKFGKSTIKAVARSKSGSFIVATTATQKGRPFCFPK